MSGIKSSKCFDINQSFYWVTSKQSSHFTLFYFLFFFFFLSFKTVSHSEYSDSEKLKLSSVSIPNL